MLNSVRSARASSSEFADPETTAPADDRPPVDRAWATARDLFPGSPWQRLWFGSGQTFRVQVGAGLPEDRFHFHNLRLTADGTLAGVTRAEDASLAQKLPSMVGRLHIGDYGTTYRVAAFIACVVGVTLPITGFVIWLPRWRRRRARAKSA